MHGRVGENVKPVETSVEIQTNPDGTRRVVFHGDIQCEDQAEASRVEAALKTSLESAIRAAQRKVVRQAQRKPERQ